MAITCKQDVSMTSETRMWRHVRVLYTCTCVLAGLLVTMGWLGHRELTRLRTDMDGQLLPRRVVEFSDSGVDEALLQRGFEPKEDDYQPDKFTREESTVHEPGFESNEEEELLRVRRSTRRDLHASRHGRDSSNARGGSRNQAFYNEGSGAPDDWAWVTSYSRIPVFALQEFCSRTKEYCPAAEPGPPGLPGQQGDVGIKGEKGDLGLDGLSGEKGEHGDNGEKGEAGDQGLSGFPGPDGEKGDKGDEGERGVNGTAGTEGPAGPTGLRGPPGQDGAPGLTGFPGPQGEAGFNGTDGERGKRGKKGVKGDGGEMGLPGLKGDIGLPGEPPDVSTLNCTCEPGLPGPRGEAMDGLPGPPGIAGPRGPKGDKGDQGSNLRLETTTPEPTTTTTIATTTVEPTVIPREKECRIRMVGKPLFQRYISTYWGAWMRDQDPPTVDDGRKTLYTRHFTGRFLTEFNNFEHFRHDKPDKGYELKDMYFGTGHVIYRGAFIYHHAGHNKIIKYDLGRELVVATQTFPHAVYQGKDTVYSTEYNYFDIETDENGLWVIYGSSESPTSLLVTKLDPDFLQVLKTWNITVNHRHYGNGFITCGVLYLVKNTRSKTTVIDFAYDLYTKSEVNIRLKFTNPFQMNNMISYNSREKKIYSWDKGNVLTYPLLM